jgi:hypothetical protein
MKGYFIAFLIALAITASLFGADPPQPMEIGISDVKEATKRKTLKEIDYTYGNFLITDSPRPKTFMTNVVEKSNKARTRAQFPISAN